ncbi:MAG: hypothetical protein ABL886_02680 [Rhodoglobus sp.]
MGLAFIRVPHRIAIGATLGQDVVRPHLDALARRRGEPSTVVIDLSEVEAANASFLKATLLELLWRGQAYADAEDSPSGPPRDALNVFPLVQGLSPEVREELETVLSSERMPALESVVSDADRIVSGRVLGRLDDALTITLAALTSEGSSTAPQLCEKYPQRNVIKATAWNNRLADLYRHRLVTRERAGRQWIYGAIAKELADG